MAATKPFFFSPQALKHFETANNLYSTTEKTFGRKNTQKKIQ